MSLDGWQLALVDRLTGAGTAPTDMNNAEASWIAAATSTAGFAITRRVQREWRAFRIGNALPLTTRLLAGALDGLMERYLAEVREPASFFLREAEQFVAWCPIDGAVHFDAVSRFELAMLRAAQTTGGAISSDPPHGDVLVHATPGTDVVAFDAPPALVLGSLAAGVRPPAPGAQRHRLLCSPRACREALPGEEAMVARLKQEASPAGALDGAVLRTLWAAGAVIVS
jgi:hypothetical protein